MVAPLTAAKGARRPDLTRHAAKWGAVVLGGRVVGRVARLAVQVVLGRLLGPAAYGIYVLGRAAVDVLKTVGGMGSDRGGLRHLAIFRSTGDSKAARRVVRSALGVGAGVSLVTAVALFAGAGWVAGRFTEPGLEAPLRIFAIGLPVTTAAFILSGLLRGADRIGADAWTSEILNPLVQLLLLGGVAFLAVGSRLAGAVWAFNAAFLVTAAAAFVILRRAVPPARSAGPSAFSGRGFWAYSLSLLAIELGALLLTRLDRLVLGSAVTSAQLGLYGGASVFSQQNTFLLAALNVAFAPRVAQLESQGRTDDLARLLKTLHRWTTTTSAPIILVTVLLAPDLMGLMGPSFAAAYRLLVILTVGQAVNTFAGSVGIVLNMTGNQRLELRNTTANVLLLPVLLVLLVPRYGPMGAAFAVAGSMSIINAARVAEVYWVFRIHPFSSELWKVGVASSAALVVWLLVAPHTVMAGPIRLIVGSALIVAVYLLVTLQLGLNWADRRLVVAIRRRLLTRWGRVQRGGERG